MVVRVGIGAGGRADYAGISRWMWPHLAPCSQSSLVRENPRAKISFLTPVRPI